MQKIPTLFQRDPDDRARVLPDVTPGCEWVLAGEGKPLRKHDGTCVLIRRDGLAVRAFTRREVKPGKTPPTGFVQVEHDEATGKTVGWEPGEQSPFAKPLRQAIEDAEEPPLPGTYELCGPKINGNPDGYEGHVLIPHAEAEGFRFIASLTYENVRDAVTQLGKLGWEGLVWHHPDGRMAKIKAKDFG